MTIRDLVFAFQEKLPAGEISLLIAHGLKKDRSFIFTHPEYTLSENEKKRIVSSLKKRCDGKPVAYIKKEKDFFGITFRVNKNTLIPRPETEILVEETLKHIEKIPHAEKIFFLDIGTGSGNIPIAIAFSTKERIDSIDMIAGDISEGALRIAKKNQEKILGNFRIQFRKSFLTQNIPKKYYQHQHWVITANLPYLSTKIFKSSQKDVQFFEPKTALVAEDHGMELIKKLLRDLSEKINDFSPKSFFCILEISPEQSNYLQKIATSLFRQKKVSILHDLAQKKRCLVIQEEAQ